ncbi:hypothetical protein M408DRAFT_72712 [Serendipita vermifera MAFF 305830]|uniref:Uncharacterized protein n=1 Tax=Serendipita vermifera MAFF 305830 TaxID=933852 RepID=A0A0C3APC7_SERVB|nr:hypothetical protein M408DRAFT_72712 [Serendipita vermifera MAFF 305830]
MNPHQRKLVCVGDGAVGKTSLLIVFARGDFPRTYTPSVLDNHVVNIEVKGEAIELALWDTSAQGEFEDRLRPLVYPGSHVVLICFSIDYPESLDNVIERWVPEVKHFTRDIPHFLVGCKKDLRDNPDTVRVLANYGQAPVAYAQGEDIARTIGAVYLECSALTGEGVRELFLETTEMMDPKRANQPRRKSGCIAM